MTPKPLPKRSHESDRKVSAESQRPARQGWEWIWVLEGNWIKRETSRLLEVAKEKLTPKRLRSLLGRKTDGVYQSNNHGNSPSSRGEHATKSSTSDVANTYDRTTLRSSTLSRGGRSTSGTCQSSKKLLRGLQYLSPIYPHFRSPTGEPEGLYCMTKRGIGVGPIGKPKEVGCSMTESMLWISQTVGCIQACSAVPGGIAIKGYSNTQRCYERFGPISAGRLSPKHAIPRRRSHTFCCFTKA